MSVNTKYKLKSIHKCYFLLFLSVWWDFLDLDFLDFFLCFFLSLSDSLLDDVDEDDDEELLVDDVLDDL